MDTNGETGVELSDDLSWGGEVGGDGWLVTLGKTRIGRVRLLSKGTYCGVRADGSDICSYVTLEGALAAVEREHRKASVEFQAISPTNWIVRSGDVHLGSVEAPLTNGKEPTFTAVSKRRTTVGSFSSLEAAGEALLRHHSPPPPNIPPVRVLPDTELEITEPPDVLPIRTRDPVAAELGLFRPRTDGIRCVDLGQYGRMYVLDCNGERLLAVWPGPGNAVAYETKDYHARRLVFTDAPHEWSTLWDDELPDILWADEPGV